MDLNIASNPVTPSHGITVVDQEEAVTKLCLICDPLWGLKDFDTYESGLPNKLKYVNSCNNSARRLDFARY